MDISRHFFVGWLLSSLACGGQGPSAQQSPQALRAAGTDARPFNATFSYPAGATRVTCLDPPACTRILFEAETSGYAQGLGDATVSQRHVAVFASDAPPVVTDGVATITLRSGTISVTYSGPVLPTPVPGLILVQLTWTNTGGTGRFAGGGGSGSIDVIGHPDGTFLAAIQGTLILPHDD